MRGRVVFALIPVGLGILSLAGWLTGAVVLASFHAGLPTMKPVAGICMILAGLAVLAVPEGPDRAPHGNLVFAILAGLAVATSAALALGLHLFGNSGAAQASGSWLAAVAEASKAWNIAPATAFNLFVSGVIIAALAKFPDSRRVTLMGHAMAVLVGLVAMFALAIYLTDVEALYSVSVYSTMSLPTVIASGGLATAILLTSVSKGWLGSIFNLPARRVMLHLAPAAFISPLFAGTAVVLALRARLIPPAFADPTVVCVTALWFLAAAWYVAHSIGRAETMLVGAHDAMAERVRAAVIAKERSDQFLRHGQRMQALGELVGRIAHDFNNYLTVIVGSANILQQGLLPKEKRARHLSAIAASAAHATDLTSRLLAFAQMRPPQSDVVDIGQLVSGIADIMSYAMGKRIGIQVAIPADVWNVRIDPRQFEVALLNLAVNARDAMAGEGLMTIDVVNVTRDEEELVCLRVGDSGCGMSAAVMERAAEPFFTTKATGGGTGLGLAQVYAFAEESGGSVRVESEVGVGSSFTFFLPRFSGEPGAAPMAA